MTQTPAVTSLLAPGDAAQLTRVLLDHPTWSIFWDKRHALWRAAEDDPGSSRYAESPDLAEVIAYITTSP